MTQSHDAMSTETAHLQFKAGLRWARGGWDRVRSDLPLWLGMSGLFLVPAALLIQLPFAGALIVVLLCPMLLGGALLAAAEHSNPALVGSSYQRWVKRPARELLQALADPTHVYPIVLLGIVTLGLVVTVFIVQHLFGIGSLSGLRSASTLGTASTLSLLLGALVAGLLHVALLLALFFAVHRTLFAKRDPLTAMSESLSACIKHAWAILGLACVFAVPYLVIISAFNLSVLLGYLLLFTVGLVSLPALVVASYYSYRDVFAGLVK